jgi:hypothetical protein
MIVREETVTTARKLVSMSLLVARNDAEPLSAAARLEFGRSASPCPPYPLVAKISFVVLGEPA